jgi:hypothetical protein
MTLHMTATGHTAVELAVRRTFGADAVTLDTAASAIDEALVLVERTEAVRHGRFSTHVASVNPDRPGLFTGHYFDTEAPARADFAARVARGY